MLESIPVGDLPPPHGMELLRPHRRVMHYYVEGYHVPDVDAAVPDILPKGIEIRTPPCESIARDARAAGDAARTASGCAGASAECRPSRSPTTRWTTSSRVPGNAELRALAVGDAGDADLRPGRQHQPAAHLAERIDEADLFAKVNYYAPALVALSLASPYHRGKPWIINGRVGKSLRTYRRSVVGQALRVHPRQQGRLEFKSFEMTHRLGDFHAYLLLWLTLAARRTPGGPGVGPVAGLRPGGRGCDGLAVDHVRDRAAEVLERPSASCRSGDSIPRPWSRSLDGSPPGACRRTRSWRCTSRISRCTGC